jgi:hypothetical protein
MIRVRTFCQVMIFLVFCNFLYAENNKHEDYKKLIIKKWFKSEKLFDTVMSWKFQNKYPNKLEEFKLPFFKSLNIKKMFAIDTVDINFAKERKILIIDTKGLAHYIEKESECFEYIKKQYIPQKHGIDFIFNILLFIKHCNGYKFATEEKYPFFHFFLEKNPELLKKSRKLEIIKVKNKFLCQAYFSTMNGNAIILFEIGLSSNSVKVTRKFKKIFLRFH